MASSSSKRGMDSSSSKRSSYDVFLSFRGEDVRKTFLGHLYAALVQNGIHTYKDDKNLGIGEQISPALMKAIEESRIAIVIFSENYASSTWCLDELAKIMECEMQGDLTVFPVFYKVDPREVRTPREIYKLAMDEHEKKFMNDSGKEERWKGALSAAGKLSGLHFTDGCEVGLIHHIVREISIQLDRLPLAVAKFPVEIDSQVQMLQDILNLHYNDDVLMIGLWGKGGIGKTTLAKATYNAVFREFEGSSFLECVRENSKSSDMVALQEKLLSEVLLGREVTSYSVARGSCLIQERLHNKKVLIILDDVDDRDQLNALVGNYQLFGNGSRIIITTRDKHLLTSHGVDQYHIYEVKALGNGAALELFRKHAFQGNQEIKINSDIVDGVLNYAKGIPLALEVLGCFLCGREEDEWKSTLQKLAKCPDKNINDVLKISYDGLEGYSKEIFLDIACFFKGRETEYIKKVLHSCCDFDTTIGVKYLIERSLITEECGTLQMHDLIQLMGIDIIEEECRDDPGKRSRLWRYEDVHEVLSQDIRTDVVKAIVLMVREREEMHIGPNTFKNMRNLRLLILHNVQNLFTGPIHLPNRLKWFEWPHCTSVPEFSNGPKKLVGLDLRNTNINIERVLEKFKDFTNLKFVNFSGCQSLACMPNLDYTPNLEELDLSGCNNLEHAHKSVTYHGKLRLLNLSGCSNLLDLPDVLQTKNLQRLILANCSRLQSIPNLDYTPNLEELDFSGCNNLEHAHKSVAYHDKLRVLNLSGCSNLLDLPDVLQTKNLQHLFLAYCSKLQRFPFNPSKTKSLQKLDLVGTSIEELPASVENLIFLKEMNLTNCKKLSILPFNIYRLPNLHRLWLGGCSKLIKFPKKEDDSSDPHKKTGFPKLNLLSLSGCNLSEVEFLANPSCFPSLRELHLKGNHITSFPLCEHLYKLHYFNVERCDQLQEIIEITGRGLRMSADDCKSLSKIIGHVETIYLSSGQLVSNVPAIDDLLKLKHACPGNRFIDVTLPRGEMPEWLLPNNDGIISFMASRDFMKKVLGFVVYVVFQVKEGKELCLSSGDSFTRSGQCNRFYDNANHGWLNYRDLSPRQGDHFGPNEWRCFRYSIRASPGGIMKKCGFRLICKPLESNLDSFLQHNQSLDPDLLYEVWREESQMSIVEERSSEREELQDGSTSTEEDSSSKSVHKESNIANFSIEKYRYSNGHHRFRNIHLGGGMPEEFVLVEDGTISFKASQNLYDKILGLAFCAILSVEDGKKDVSFDIVPCINGERRNVLSGTLRTLDSNHMWTQYLKSNTLWGMLEGGVDFGEFDEKYLRFSLRLEVSGGIVKKLGYVIRCGQLEDDLRVELEENPLVNFVSLCEVCYQKEDLKMIYSSQPGISDRECLRKCKLRIEELESSWH